MRRFLAGLLFALVVVGPLQVVSQMDPIDVTTNSPLKYFRMYIQNTQTNEIQPCFPKDYSVPAIQDISKVFDSYRDRSNFVFGFDGLDDFEFHDCSGTTGRDIVLNPWGCHTDIVQNANANGQRIWTIKIDFAFCDHEEQQGLEPGKEMFLEYYDFREFAKRQTFQETLELTWDRISRESDFRRLYRYESTYSETFGPTNEEPNLIEMRMNFLRNGEKDYVLQINVPIRSYSYCIEAQRCLEAIYVGMDVPSSICPFHPCPPGYNIYKDDLCYFSLVPELIDVPGPRDVDYYLPVPAFQNNTVKRITGTRDCVDRDIDTNYCYAGAKNLVQECFNTVNTDYGFTGNT